MNQDISTAKALLKGSGISLLDAARIVRNILDARPKAHPLSPLQFCAKVAEAGKLAIRTEDMTVEKGFEAYLAAKKHLRGTSQRDLRYLGGRLLRTNPEYASLYFAQFTRKTCEDWLERAFETPNQFNKGRAFLHAFFGYALGREWCDKNPVQFIPRRKVIEREIMPLSLEQIDALMREANRWGATAATGLLIFAGIRPREVRRLRWADIDLKENSVTIRSQCSKTGGVRHVEICPKLRHLLLRAHTNEPTICPKNWMRRWRRIRHASGLNKWVPDVLRHTYASYHAKRYHNLHRLQLNMGHRDTSLLRARYVNVRNILQTSACQFFAPTFAKAV